MHEYPSPAGVDVDPERHEIDLLLELAPTLRGARVLEVGCGDGRLTWRYADRPSSVLAIDTNPERVAAACSRQSMLDGSPITFRVCPVAALDPGSGPFDVVIMSWSL
jgi:2-polyprenyl-3-methyl-5-hydroxy-6-metoxy-1,4-benzoquinol methylase